MSKNKELFTPQEREVLDSLLASLKQSKLSTLSGGLLSDTGEIVVRSQDQLPRNKPMLPPAEEDKNQARPQLLDNL